MGCPGRLLEPAASPWWISERKAPGIDFSARRGAAPVTTVNWCLRVYHLFLRIHFIKMQLMCFSVCEGLSSIADVSSTEIEGGWV